MKWGTSKGPRTAQFAIVAETFGREEEDQGIPLVGESGRECERMLSDAGIDSRDVFFTNVANARPPDNKLELWCTPVKARAKENNLLLERNGVFYNDIIAQGLQTLYRDLAEVQPRVVVALGNAALWALGGKWGVGTWRGSVLPTPFGSKFIPTYHPANIPSQWENRWIAVHDLKRAKGELAFPEIRTPPYDFLIRPSFDHAQAVLNDLLAKCDRERTRLAVDLETRLSMMACCGIAWSPLHAICIPLMDSIPLGKDYLIKSYWAKEEELAIVKQLRRLLTHPNAEIVGQNFLYDEQYIARYWGVRCNTYMDTMIAHHLCWPGTDKGLDYLSSLYCEFHQYWKEEGKLWDPRTTPPEQLWVYNCKDAVITFEVSQVLDSSIDHFQLRPQFEFQRKVYSAVFDMMLRGTEVDRKLRAELVLTIQGHIFERDTVIHHLLGKDWDEKFVNSPKQMQRFFYERLGLNVQRDRKTKRPTTGEDALKVLAKDEPLVQRLCYSIIERRTLQSSVNVLKRPLGNDGRLRCSYNIPGTETFRFSSSEDAFESGTNLQNLTPGGVSEYTGLSLPNMRRLIVPESGHLIADVDLDRADLQVVVWEADDAGLKWALRNGVDMHLYNARDIYKLDIPDDEIVETHPKCEEHKARFKRQRNNAKAGVHATDYYCKPPTLAKVLNCTVHEAELFQRGWFTKHPGILEWHRRTEAALSTTRSVRNQFGFRIVFFGRIDTLLPSALAWIPQSTVALVINKALVNLHEKAPNINLLLQVHDSLTFQLRILKWSTTLQNLRPHLNITVPYPDPLIIPVGFKLSEKSWGDCEPLAKFEKRYGT